MTLILVWLNGTVALLLVSLDRDAQRIQADHLISPVANQTKAGSLQMQFLETPTKYEIWWDLCLPEAEHLQSPDNCEPPPLLKQKKNTVKWKSPAGWSPPITMEPLVHQRSPACSHLQRSPASSLWGLMSHVPVARKNIAREQKKRSSAEGGARARSSWVLGSITHSLVDTREADS